MKQVIGGSGPGFVAVCVVSSRTLSCLLRVALFVEFLVLVCQHVAESGHSFALCLRGGTDCVY